jgi:DNA-binding NarL/FixJ family response regulator
MSERPRLMMVNAFIGTASYKALYEQLGYSVVIEYSERKAISQIKKIPPDVIVADFFHQPDFRDRLSNLESLLATAQRTPATRILVFYDPAHQDMLDKVRQRMRIDAAMSLPVQEAELAATLTGWIKDTLSPPIAIP